jgi:quercetin dioxygenase-like cupin family protein
MPDTAAHFLWSEIPVEPLNPLLSRQFVTGEQAMLARIVLTKGCVVPTHHHHNEQISYILSGALEFVLEDGTPGGRRQVVRAGEVLVIPGHLPHSATALEDTVNLDVFAPPRQDWIDRDDSYLR